MEFQEDITELIPKKDQSKVKNARFVHGDKTVGVLGEFPELTKAVREGDLATVSFLCAQLFDSNSVVSSRRSPAPLASLDPVTLADVPCVRPLIPNAETGDAEA